MLAKVGGKSNWGHRLFFFLQLYFGKAGIAEKNVGANRANES
jgi:hypothetical protein